MKMSRNAWRSAIKAKIELVTRRNVPCLTPTLASPGGKTERRGASSWGRFSL